MNPSENRDTYITLIKNFQTSLEVQETNHRVQDIVSQSGIP